MSSSLIACLAVTACGVASAQSTTLTYNPGSTVKLEQVIGDCDYQAQAIEIVAGQPLTCVPTTSQTVTRAERRRQRPGRIVRSRRQDDLLLWRHDQQQPCQR